jgi:hypothetical protein
LTLYRSISREIKQDTHEIRQDTSAIKDDTAQILAEITRLRAQLPRETQNDVPNLMLERYLDNLTSYAESVVGEEDGLASRRTSYKETLVEEEKSTGTTLEEHDETASMLKLADSAIDDHTTISGEERSMNLLEKYDKNGLSTQQDHVLPPTVDLPLRGRTEPPTTSVAESELLEQCEGGVCGTRDLSLNLPTKVVPSDLPPTSPVSAKNPGTLIYVHEASIESKNEEFVPGGSHRILSKADTNDIEPCSIPNSEGDQNEVDTTPPRPPPRRTPTSTSENKASSLFRGNLVVDIEVPYDIIQPIPHALPPARDEYTHTRYTAVTCDPASFVDKRYHLRHEMYFTPRRTEVLFMVDIPANKATNALGLEKTLASINHMMKLWERLPDFTSSCPNIWKGIVVCLQLKGFAPDEYSQAPSVKPLLQRMGILPKWDYLVERCSEKTPFASFYGDRKHQLQFSPSGSGEFSDCFYDTLVHLFEVGSITSNVSYISQILTDFQYTVTLFPRGINSGMSASECELVRGPPMQMILCDETRPQPGNWSRAIGGMLDAKLCVEISAGDVVHSKTIFKHWQNALPRSTELGRNDGMHLKIIDPTNEKGSMRRLLSGSW